MFLVNRHSTPAEVHADERGIEAVQSVIILAIAGVAMLAIRPAWNAISEWASSVITELLR